MLSSIISLFVIISIFTTYAVLYYIYIYKVELPNTNCITCKNHTGPPGLDGFTMNGSISISAVSSSETALYRETIFNKIVGIHMDQSNAIVHMDDLGIIELLLRISTYVSIYGKITYHVPPIDHPVEVVCMLYNENGTELLLLGFNTFKPSTEDKIYKEPISISAVFPPYQRFQFGIITDRSVGMTITSFNASVIIY